MIPDLGNINTQNPGISNVGIGVVSNMNVNTATGILESFIILEVYFDDNLS